MKKAHLAWRRAFRKPAEAPRRSCPATPERRVPVHLADGLGERPVGNLDDGVAHPAQAALQDPALVHVVLDRVAHAAAPEELGLAVIGVPAAVADPSDPGGSSGAGRGRRRPTPGRRRCAGSRPGPPGVQRSSQSRLKIQGWVVFSIPAWRSSPNLLNSTCTTLAPCPAAISAVLSVLNESITTISAAQDTLSSAGPICSSSLRERMKTDTGGLVAMAGLGRRTLSPSRPRCGRSGTRIRSCATPVRGPAWPRPTGGRACRPLRKAGARPP